MCVCVLIIHIFTYTIHRAKSKIDSQVYLQNFGKEKEDVETIKREKLKKIKISKEINNMEIDDLKKELYENRYAL